MIESVLQDIQQQILAFELRDERQQVFLYLISSLLICCGMKQFFHKTGIPENLTILVVGYFLSYFRGYLGYYGDCINYTIENTSIDLICLILFPTIIFMDNFTSDFYQMSKEVFNGCILSFPAMFISIFLHAMTFKYILNYEEDFTFFQAMNVAAMMAPASPGMFINKMQSFGISDKYQTVFQYEKQFGLAMAFIICKVFNQSNNVLAEFNLKWVFEGILLNFLQSLVLGVGIGIIFSFWLRRQQKDQIVLTSVMYLCPSILAFAALSTGSLIGLSSVSLGLFLCYFVKVHIKKDVLANAVTFFNTINWCFENILVFFAGNLMAMFLNTNERIGINDYFKLILMLIMSYIIRAFSIIIFFEKMKNKGYGMTYKKIAIITLANEKTMIVISLYVSSTNRQDFQITFFYGMFMYFASIIVNSILSSDYVINKLDIQEKQPFKQNIRVMINQLVKQQSLQKIEAMKYSNLYQQCDWKFVMENAQLQELPVSKEYENQNLQYTQQDLLEYSRYEILNNIKRYASIRLNDTRTSAKAYQEIEYACNYSEDNVNEPIQIWEIIKNKFKYMPMMDFLFRFKNIAFVGKYIKQQVNQNVSKIYELCILTSDSMKDAIENFDNFELYQEKIPIVINHEVLNQQYISSRYNKEREKLFFFIYHYHECRGIPKIWSPKIGGKSRGQNFRPPGAILASPGGGFSKNFFSYSGGIFKIFSSSGRIFIKNSPPLGIFPKFQNQGPQVRKFNKISKIGAPDFFGGLGGPRRL